MSFIVSIALQFLIALVLATLMAPKSPNVKPLGFSDFDFPTASQSRPIPVVWGKQELRAPNLVWAGDFLVEEITESVRTGLKKTKITVGFRYYMGMQLALCMGSSHTTARVKKITQLRFGEKVAWSGDALPETYVTVDERSLYGGDKQGGGIYGTFKVYDGKSTQSLDSYLAGEQGVYASAHSGVCHVVWYGPSFVTPIEGGGEVSVLTPKNGYVSNSSTLRPLWFTLERYPNQLGVTGGKEQIGIGANPACMILELLTDVEWGMGWPEGTFSRDDLLAMADTLYAENFGLAMTWDNEKTVESVLEDIMTHIGGFYYEDPTTGMMRFGLYRDDFVLEDLDELSEPTILSVSEFTRSSWDGSVNEISVSYSNPDNNFELALMTVNDLGNAYIQGKAVPNTVQYHGIVDRNVAIEAGYRDLRAVSNPLARATFVCRRDVSDWHAGKRFKWTDPLYGVGNMVMRVTKVDLGTFENGEIVIYASQDPFGFGDSIYVAPPVTEWTPPTTDPVALNDNLEFELPVGISAQPTLEENNELTVLVANTSPTNLTYVAKSELQGEELVTNSNDETVFTATRDTLTAIDMHDPVYDANATIELTGGTGSVPVGLGLDFESVAYINGELIAYDTLEVSGTGVLCLKGIYRGLLNTVVNTHPVGSRIWFIGSGGFTPVSTYSDGQTIEYTLNPEALGGSLDEGTLTVNSYTFTGEKSKPYVCTDYKANGGYRPETLIKDEDLVITWGNNPKDDPAGIINPTVTNKPVELDTDYTVTIKSGTTTLDAQTVQVLAGATALNSHTVTWATLFDGEVTYPPELKVLLSAQEVTSTETSTQTATKVVPLSEYTTNDLEGQHPNEAIHEVVLFNGDLIGARES